MSIILRLFGYQNLNIHWVSGLHILEPSGRAKGGEGWAAPLQGGQFRSQMYFYYTNRGIHNYLAPGGNTPCSATARTLT